VHDDGKRGDNCVSNVVVSFHAAHLVSRQIRSILNLEIEFCIFVKTKRMKTAVEYQLNFNQIMQIVRKLPANKKIRLSKELEKEAINSKLVSLLKSFKTKELTDEVIMQKCEIVRAKLYSE